jgi:hypothetical protein
VARSTLGLSKLGSVITPDLGPATARENVLITMTSHNTFYISIDEVELAQERCQYELTQFANFKIYDTSGGCVGWIEVNVGWVNPRNTDVMGFDFVLLSELALCRDSYPGKPVDPQIEQITLKTRSDILINVMLIEKCSETTVRRVAVGWVTEEAWIAAKPTPYLLQLE